MLLQSVGWHKTEPSRSPLPLEDHMLQGLYYEKMYYTAALKHASFTKWYNLLTVDKKEQAQQHLGISMQAASRPPRAIFVGGSHGPVTTWHAHNHKAALYMDQQATEQASPLSQAAAAAAAAQPHLADGAWSLRGTTAAVEAAALARSKASLSPAWLRGLYGPKKQHNSASQARTVGDADKSRAASSSGGYGMPTPTTAALTVHQDVFEHLLAQAEPPANAAAAAAASSLDPVFAAADVDYDDYDYQYDDDEEEDVADWDCSSPQIQNPFTGMLASPCKRQRTAAGKVIVPADQDAGPAVLGPHPGLQAEAPAAPEPIPARDFIKGGRQKVVEALASCSGPELTAMMQKLEQWVDQLWQYLEELRADRHVMIVEANEVHIKAGLQGRTVQVALLCGTLQAQALKAKLQAQHNDSQHWWSLLENDFDDVPNSSTAAGLEQDHYEAGFMQPFLIVHTRFHLINGGTLQKEYGVGCCSDYKVPYCSEFRQAMSRLKVLLLIAYKFQAVPTGQQPHAMQQLLAQLPMPVKVQGAQATWTQEARAGAKRGIAGL
jgi:hypothetical protein